MENEAVLGMLGYGHKKDQLMLQDHVTSPPLQTLLEECPQLNILYHCPPCHDDMYY